VGPVLHQKKRKKWLFVSAILLLIFLAFVLWHFKGESSVSVRFLGYTNDTKGVLLGSFCVENKGSHEMNVGVLPPEVQDATGWKATGVHSYHVLTTVEAQGTWVVDLPAPTNQVAWRLPVSYWSPQSDSARFRFGQFLKKHHLAEGDQYFCPTVVSLPVAPDALNAKKS
jgi:hypothetical protein